jgi:hypothetical protein
MHILVFKVLEGIGKAKGSELHGKKHFRKLLGL